MHGVLRLSAIWIFYTLFCLSFLSSKNPHEDVTLYIVSFPFTSRVLGIQFYVLNLVGFTIILLKSAKLPSWFPKRYLSSLYSLFTCLPVSLSLQISLLSPILSSVIRARIKIEPFLDSTENKWSFGQVVPMVFILLVFITAAEIWNEQTYSGAKPSNPPDSGAHNTGSRCAIDMQSNVGASSDEAPDTSPANFPAQTDALLAGSQQYPEALEDEEGNSIQLSEGPRRVDTEMGYKRQDYRTGVEEADNCIQVQKRHTYPAGRQQH